MSKDKINIRQFTLFVTLFTIGSSILFIPLSSATSAKQSGWISILIGMCATLGIVWMYLALAREAPGCTLVEMNRKWLGKWLGSLTSIFYIITTLILAGPSLLYYLGEFMVVEIMMRTPMEVLIIMFAVVVCMGMRMGLTTLGRAAEVLFALFVVLFVLLILFSIPNMKLEQLRPVFATGTSSILGAALDYVSFSGMPLIVLLMLYPLVADSPHAAKAYYGGTIIGGGFLLIMTVVCVSVIGVENTLQQAYPSYELAKKINIAGVLTRIEVIMATIWIISLFFKLILYFYAGIKGMAQLLRIENERLLVLPIGVMMVVLSLMEYPDTAYRSWWDSKIWPPYIATFGFLLPVLLLVIAKLRKLRSPSG
ncbi:GerAB/ArcD/ProY family transporter [Paenibacillus ginsengarvi]|uniref:Spore gernimation protein KB n=1 Tax=Paenibacillus ginsengarvi TaxID=400777 RepID=A0A3B0CM96_9BACL|nr:endospore germination permease [Paenibacillus ginsengarvi]RKN86080.1 spore gernimation protein KB [Paenibacillus ginsengarvi]